MNGQWRTYLNWKKLILLGLAGFLFSFAEAQDIDYKSQSLFIYKFTRHISWPDQSAKNDFVIGVYGNSAIIGELQAMASLKKAGDGQRIVVRQVNSVEEMGNLQILYVASSKSRELRDIAAKVGNRSTLIVAEREGLAKKGACINFIILENNTLRFEINRNELKNHGLSINPELLKIGFSVG